jgi:hypothetical protein
MSRSQQGNESYPQDAPAPETTQASGAPEPSPEAVGLRPPALQPGPGAQGGAPHGSHTVVLPSVPSPVPVMPTLRSPAPGPSPELLRAAAGPRSAAITEPTPLDQIPQEPAPQDPTGFRGHDSPAAPGGPAPYLPAPEYPRYPQNASPTHYPAPGSPPPAAGYPHAPAAPHRPPYSPAPRPMPGYDQGYGSIGYPSVPPPPPGQGQGPGQVPWYSRLSLESPVMMGAVGIVAIGLVTAILMQFLDGDSSQPTATDTGNANQTTATETTVESSKITAKASSTQEPEKNGVTYSVDNTLDGDPSTAWNSNGRKDGPGEGMSLTYTFDEPVDLTRIALRNGYQKIRTRANGQSLNLYQLNKRVRKIQVVTDKGSWTWDVADQQASQELAQDFGTAAWVRLEVLETYQSARYKDLAVSEVTFTAAG